MGRVAGGIAGYEIARCRCALCSKERRSCNLRSADGHTDPDDKQGENTVHGATPFF